MHSVAGGRKAEAVASPVPAALHADLVAAAVLNNVGHTYPETGFHPLDGARVFARSILLARICHLVEPS